MLPKGKHTVQYREGRRSRRGNRRKSVLRNKRSLNFKCLTTWLNYVPSLARSNDICRWETISASQAVHCQTCLDRQLYILRISNKQNPTLTNNITPIGSSTLEADKSTNNVRVAYTFSVGSNCQNGGIYQHYNVLSQTRPGKATDVAVNSFWEEMIAHSG